MKKIILLFTLFSAMMISHAQIWIGPWDVPVAGKVLQRANDTMKTKTPGSINPGSAGANQTWNFSNLSSNTVDTLTFTNPAWTPYGSSFPNSNLAVMNSKDTSVSYLENKSTGLFVDGTYANPLGQGFMVIKINPAEELNSFNNTYNSTFQNTSVVDVKIPYTKQAGVDSVHLKHTVMKDVKTDGWGSVTTPLGNNYSCLRERGQVITIDSIWAHVIFPSSWVMPAQPVRDTAYHFSWWASGMGLPLVEFDSTKADTIRNITWLKTVAVIGGVNETSSLNEVNTYPNPSSGQFIIHSQLTKNYDLEIYNVFGEHIFQKNITKKDELINLNVPNGIYFLHITSKEGTVTRKVIISK